MYYNVQFIYQCWRSHMKSDCWSLEYYFVLYHYLEINSTCDQFIKSLTWWTTFPCDLRWSLQSGSNELNSDMGEYLSSLGTDFSFREALESYLKGIRWIDAGNHPANIHLFNCLLGGNCLTGLNNGLLMPSAWVLWIFWRKSLKLPCTMERVKHVALWLIHQWQLSTIKIMEVSRKKHTCKWCLYCQSDVIKCRKNRPVWHIYQIAQRKWIPFCSHAKLHQMIVVQIFHVRILWISNICICYLFSCLSTRSAVMISWCTSKQLLRAKTIVLTRE